MVKDVASAMLRQPDRRIINDDKQNSNTSQNVAMQSTLANASLGEIKIDSGGVFNNASGTTEKIDSSGGIFNSNAKIIDDDKQQTNTDIDARIQSNLANASLGEIKIDSGGVFNNTSGTAEKRDSSGSIFNSSAALANDVTGSLGTSGTAKMADTTGGIFDK